MSRTLLAAAAALTSVALLPAAAHAKPGLVTYAVKLDAHRTITWDHPRTENGGDCNGKSYIEGRGSDDFKLWSGTTGRLVLEGSAKRLTSSSFGTEGKGRTLVSDPPEAKSVITRTRRMVTGRTGGWCGGAVQDPIENGDCGTKLVPFTYRVTVDGGEIGFTETRGSSEREKYHFYDCPLTVPGGMYRDTFPKLKQKLPLARLFGKKGKPITIEAKQEYGPTLFPLGAGVNMTASGGVTWTLTLTRVGDLKPRSENG